MEPLLILCPTVGNSPPLNSGHCFVKSCRFNLTYPLLTTQKPMVKTEYINQILEQYFCIYINYQQDNWSSLLPLTKFAYNNTEHIATSVSSSFVNKGFHPKMDISFNNAPSTAASLIAMDLSELRA